MSVVHVVDVVAVHHCGVAAAFAVYVRVCLRGEVRLEVALVVVAVVGVVQVAVVDVVHMARVHRC